MDRCFMRGTSKPASPAGREMRPSASTHMSQAYMSRPLYPTQNIGLPSQLPALAENYSLRERSRRGIKNSIQTCGSGPEAL